jgi:hypothetical protein
MGTSVLGVGFEFLPEESLNKTLIKYGFEIYIYISMNHTYMHAQSNQERVDRIIK